jgi:hypothetical protein
MKDLSRKVDALTLMMERIAEKLDGPTPPKKEYDFSNVKTEQDAFGKSGLARDNNTPADSY